KAAEEAEKAKAEAERKAAEETEKARVEAERKAAEAVATQQIDGYYSKISQSGMEGDDISHTGDINILELDGQKIPLLPETEPQRAEVFGNVNEKSVLVAATHLKYGRYGFYGLKNGDTDIHTSYMFYQGVITPEAAMPQEGQAFYRGYALYSDVGQANTFGNSIFMVDFGRKSLSGAVYSENGEFDEVNLEGQIVGNRFFHVDEKEQKIMSGMFLGPQAEELTGRFDHLLESKNGTFGAAALKE
ncbi:transferrin-binding protein-like solute binding protein, partial [Neisseria sp. HMSC077D05]|uniref:transferrin-binding protein-like solute binding protein n=1 Tax=Neisseria sp. HMSC077D05 TaxID=1715079 RepID=UPI001FEE3471